jgi:hypothetical protein
MVSRQVVVRCLFEVYLIYIKKKKQVLCRKSSFSFCNFKNLDARNVQYFDAINLSSSSK